ncbi:Cell death protease [Irineochytrium annulatum]|nr:Cell death protease [Irineochytrium annulatum]
MCSDTVSDQVSRGDTRNKVPTTDTVIPKLIDAGLAVYLYNGNLDYILIYVGLERAIGNMTLAGSKGFSSGLGPWFIDGVPSGLTAHERGLTYIRVEGAGHMVPLDRPTVALRILDHLVSAGSSVTTTPVTVSVTTTRKSGAWRAVFGAWAGVGAFVLALMMV